MRSFKMLSALAALTLVATGLNAQEQRSTPQPRKGSAENSLVGISLFDTGLKVVTMYGSPDEIQALTLGGAGGAGPQSGGPSGGGPAGGNNAGGGGGGAAAPQTGPEAQFSVPIRPTDPMPGFIGTPFRQGQLAPPAKSPPPGGGGGGNTADPGEGGGRGGPPAAGGGGGGGGGGTGTRVVYTRWVYHRGSSHYGFVLDKFNRVVQIEALGVNDSRVRTKRGIKFASTFSDIIKKYNAPDGYEINGDQVIVRYLVLDRVAFRLSKLRPEGKHCVTGIVVAAGKT